MLGEREGTDYAEAMYETRSFFPSGAAAVLSLDQARRLQQGLTLSDSKLDGNPTKK